MTQASSSRMSPASRYGLGLLLVIYVTNFLDRQIVTILAEPIKKDLGLADWQLGLLTGLSFALLYTVLGFPIARMAERGHRPMIIAVATGVWSLFTVACGLAQNFVQLVLARVGVGIGEAGCTTPAVSLIADYVDKDYRGRAMAIYSLGSPIGSLLGMVMGGLVADAFGWRTAFLIAGAPGLMLALVAALTLNEPRVALRAKSKAAVETAPGLREAVGSLLRSPAYCFIVCGGGLKGIFTYGSVAFVGSFLFRNHGAELSATAAEFGLKTIGFVGILMGLALGAAGLIGVYTGGWLADRLGRTDKCAYALVPAVAMALAVPLYVSGLLVSNVWLAVPLLALAHGLSTIWTGPIYAMVQGIVQPRVRATAAAVQLFLSNLIGLGLGPLAIGATSDFYAASMQMGSADGIRWALITFSSSALPAALLFVLGSRTLRREMIH